MYMAKVVRCNLDIQVEIGADTRTACQSVLRMTRVSNCKPVRRLSEKAWRTSSATALAVAGGGSVSCEDEVDAGSPVVDARRLRLVTSTCMPPSCMSQPVTQANLSDWIDLFH